MAPRDEPRDDEPRDDEPRDDEPRDDEFETGPHPDPEAVESVDADLPEARDGWTRDPEDVG